MFGIGLFSTQLMADNAQNDAFNMWVVSCPIESNYTNSSVNSSSWVVTPKVSSTYTEIEKNINDVTKCE